MCCASCWAAASARPSASSAASRQRFATVLNWAGVISAAGCSNSSGLARNAAIRSATTWPIRYRFATGNRPARSAAPVGAWSRANRAELSSCDAALSVIAPRDRNQPTGLAAPSSAQAPAASHSPTQCRTSASSSSRTRNNPSSRPDRAEPDQPPRASYRSSPISSEMRSTGSNMYSTLNPGCDSYARQSETRCAPRAAKWYRIRYRPGTIGSWTPRPRCARPEPGVASRCAGWPAARAPRTRPSRPTRRAASSRRSPPSSASSVPPASSSRSTCCVASSRSTRPRAAGSCSMPWSSRPSFPRAIGERSSFPRSRRAVAPRAASPRTGFPPRRGPPEPRVTSLPDKILAIDAALDDAGIPHAFGGALALAWCTQRARGTVDIDCNVFAPVESVAATLDAMPREVTATAANRAALARDGQVRLWWDETPIDLFMNTTEFHEEVADAGASRVVRRPQPPLPVLHRPRGLQGVLQPDARLGRPRGDGGRRNARRRPCRRHPRALPRRARRAHRAGGASRRALTAKRPT